MLNKLSRWILRRMNLISDQAGILRRYFKEIENWKPHLDNTKQYIINFIQNNNFNTVSVLGSGWLLDLPVEFLENHTKKVYLYDIFHPPQIKHKLKDSKCFDFVVADITGGIILQAYNTQNQYRKTGKKVETDDLVFSGFSPLVETDCYISLNILNQLDLLITDYLKKEEIYSGMEIDKLKSEIQRSHISSLPVKRSCIITDYEELVLNMKGDLIEKRNLLYTQLPDGNNCTSWEWRFDTTGTYNIGQKTTFNVIAMEI